jgi:uncharacterized protein (TIGR00369 family)
MVETPDGYRTWSEVHRDPFEDHAGPFFYRDLTDGSVETVFEAKPHHCNGHGNIHGGLLMTFADYSLFAIARDDLGTDQAVTVSFSADFIAAGQHGSPIRGRGMVSRAAKRLIFVRGEIFQDNRVLMTYSGVLSRRPKA